MCGIAGAFLRRPAPADELRAMAQAMSCSLRHRGPDDVGEFIDERTARNPEFPALVAAAERRRELFRHLAEQRADREISQTRS